MTPSATPPKRRLNGLVIFAAVTIAVLLVITLGGNLFFQRVASSQLGPVTSTAGGSSASPTAGSNSANSTASSPVTSTSAASTPADMASLAVASAGPSAAAPRPLAHAFAPPSEASLPDDEFGKVVRRGEAIFMETAKNAPRYVGNTLNCVNCHLDAGRKAGSAPLWAAFIHYPAYRKKTGQVDTLASRIQGCFEYSMNGKAPPADDEVITALQTYAFWLATGAPVGTTVPGGGYVKLKKPALPADYARGEKVYTQNCALCHGADGQGQRAGDTQVFPPLWGPKSFNWGAGMHQMANASGFIQANMPLGKGNTLSDQEAWDVAMFMNSHERPQDPRFKGSVAATRKAFHDTDDSMYGLTVNGRVLGSP